MNAGQKEKKELTQQQIPLGEDLLNLPIQSLDAFCQRPPDNLRGIARYFGKGIAEMGILGTSIYGFVKLAELINCLQYNMEGDTLSREQAIIVIGGSFAVLYGLRRIISGSVTRPLL